MNSFFSRRVASGAAAIGVTFVLAACGGGGGGGNFDGEVKVGILHSLSGTMAISETTLKEVEEMAIKEINDAGGVNVGGKKYKITAVAEDGASDWPTFAEKAQKLIDADKVAVVFGGWTSASRKAMMPVFEAKNHILFYPIQYEGQ
ncbi:MAG: transporter substrate-binding protein, partial [Synechococcaceae cyanobacterium]|nr:transporter substrate-binding protein [Synechococcaceae cyanobacterium]